MRHLAHCKVLVTRHLLFHRDRLPSTCVCNRLWEQDVWTRKYVEDSSGKGDAFADGLELLMAQV